jgi:hypothetical protein
VVVFDFLTGELKYQKNSLKNKIESVAVNEDILSQKKLILQKKPIMGNGFILFVDSVPQRIGIDYEVNNNEIIWEGLALDGFIETGDDLTIVYNYF